MGCCRRCIMANQWGWGTGSGVEKMRPGSDWEKNSVDNSERAAWWMHLHFYTSTMLLILTSTLQFWWNIRWSRVRQSVHTLQATVFIDFLQCPPDFLQTVVWIAAHTTTFFLFISEIQISYVSWSLMADGFCQLEQWPTNGILTGRIKNGEPKSLHLAPF